MQERLQKVLSQSGVASRRKAEELILNNKVLVNNKVAKLGDKVDAEKDVIKINNKIVETRFIASKENKENFVYYILNKPKGHTCSVSDKYAEKLIIKLMPRHPKVWPVGRLDKNSTGLIILTNDGDLTYQLTHPKFEHQKEYAVIVNKKINQNFLDKMKSGVRLEEGIARADSVTQTFRSDNTGRKFNIVIHQGWKRQIRRMCRALDYQVVELKRVRIGKIKLGGLKEGEYKKLKKLDFKN